MNDFLRALEAELTAAARRKAARRARPWWRRGPRLLLPRPSLVAVAGVALLAIALGIAVAALRGGGDRTASPAPAPGTPLRALAPIVSCPTEPMPVPTPVPGASDYEKTMSVFRRAQSSPDGLAVPSGSDARDPLTWLPLAKWSPDAVRRPALGLLSTPIQLVPGTGTPGDPGCAQRASGTQSVICMVADARSTGTRCFGLADIRAGRALALIDAGTGLVAGMVPDGVQQVTLRWDGRTTTAAVTENVFETTLPGAAVGTPVRVAFGDAGCRSGAVAPELRRVVPALTLQSTGQALPPKISGFVTRGRGISAAEARLVTSSKSVRFWVVPASPRRCSDGRVDGTAVQACALAATTEQLLGVACASPADVARGTLTYADRGGGDIVAVGLSPPGTDAAVIPTPRGTAILPATEGVIGGFLPAGVKPTEVGKVTYRPIGKQPADGQIVTVVNASGVSGRDAAVAARLVQLAKGTAAEGEVLHGVATLPVREKSAVEYAPAGLDKARRVAGLLGIRDLRPLEPGVPTAKAAVVVIVGRDLRVP
jgi:LytR cell envelope-related transcriptional attenuator